MAARKDFAAMEARRPAGESAARAALRSRMAHPTSLRLDELQPNPLNPRYTDDDPEVRELADTLVRVGQLQPALIVSRDQYLAAYPDQAARLGAQPWVVLVGNRRLAASIRAGRPTLDVRVASELDSPEAFEDRILIENLQRKALPPLLEAEHLQRRLSRPGQTLRTVGESIGKSHTYVQQRLDLLKLIPDFQQLLRSGEINVKTGRYLGGLSPDEQRIRLAEGAPYRPTPPAQTSSPTTGKTELVNLVSSEAAPTLGETAHAAGSVNPVSNGAVSTGESSSRSESSLGRSPEPDPIAPAPANVATENTDPQVAAASGDPGPERAHRTDGTSDSSPVQRDPEQLRVSVAQWLESALAELDASLPGDTSSDLERALTEAQRHILAARKALGRYA